MVFSKQVLNIAIVYVRIFQVKQRKSPGGRKKALDSGRVDK
jgi:hypothetical protein